jgi:hypothetical protein
MATIVWLRREADSPDVWLIALGIAAVLIVLQIFWSKRRRQGLERAAQEMGFSFDAEGNSVETDDFLTLPLLSGNTGLSNVMRGSVSTGEAVILDCQTGSGKSARTQTVACLRLAGKQFPGFEMRPEHLFHRIGSLFGYQDIDFEGHPDFSKNYLLRGKDETAVRALFHPGLLSFFEQNTGWAVEGEGEWLAVYRPMKTVRPSAIREFVEEATRVASAFS